MGKKYTQYQECSWYECEKDKIETLRKAQKCKIIVVHADWCPDCEYTIPNFKSVMKLLPNIPIQEVEVGFNKRDRAGIAEKLKIRRIPTFVLMKENKEIGRIVEYPDDTIEGDLAKFWGAAE